MIRTSLLTLSSCAGAGRSFAEGCFCNRFFLAFLYEFSHQFVVCLVAERLLCLILYLRIFWHIVRHRLVLRKPALTCVHYFLKEIVLFDCQISFHDIASWLWEMISLRFQSLVALWFVKLIFKLKCEQITYIYVFVTSVDFHSLCNKFVWYWQHRNSEIFCQMRIQLCNTVKLLFERFALLNYFKQTTTDIVKFKMGACNRTCVFLIRIFIFRVDPFIISEVDVITVRVGIDRQIMLWAWVW